MLRRPRSDDDATNRRLTALESCFNDKKFLKRGIID